MQVTHKGSIFCQPCHDGQMNFQFWPVDASRGGFEHLGTFVKTHAITFYIDDGYDPRADMVAALEAQKQKAAAEYQKRVTELNAQIQSLLAIEA